MPSQNKFTVFDRSKLLFTVIIGLMFFFYDTDTIVNPLPTQLPSTEIIHNTPDREQNSEIIAIQQKTYKKYSITELLQWFDATQGQEYLNTYTILCQSLSYSCNQIQLQFSDLNHKEYYYSLLSLLTLLDIQNKLIVSGQLETSLIIKQDNQKKRGYATKKAIVINTKDLSDREFFEVMVHEIWHTIDLWILQWSNQDLDTKFTEFWEPSFAQDDPSFTFYALSRESEGIKKPLSNITDFCSIYGSINPVEDFSECFNLYINHHDYFVSLTTKNKILEKKYSLLSSWIQQSPYFSALSYKYTMDSAYRYRDTTKLPLKKIKK